MPLIMSPTMLQTVPPYFSSERIRSLASWSLVLDSLRSGHLCSRAFVGDTYVGDDNKKAGMLVRSAWLDDLVACTKSATIFPDNPTRTPPLPSVHAQVTLFDISTGAPIGLFDGTEITAWKTAGDSALGCDLLAPSHPKRILMVGAGAMAEPLIRAHLHVRPSLTELLLWNRSPGRVESLASRLDDLPLSNIEIVSDLDAAVSCSDIISCATMTTSPLIRGSAVKPGTHIDLVGAYKPDMREADDDVHRVGDWYVDSYDTTLDDIGELLLPLRSGIISRSDILGDLYDLVSGSCGRSGDDSITVFKNGGGAHLDAMVCYGFWVASLEN